jgi:putative hydrolase of the HAD superfamily
MHPLRDPAFDPRHPTHRAFLIRAVILDYGDVISLPPDPAIITEMAGLFKIPEKRFREIYGSFRHAYDRGSLSAHEYWTSIGEEARVNLTASDIARLREADVRMWGRLNAAILRWADRLHASGMKTAVLSNMHDDMVQHVRKNGEWTRRFDCLTLSSALHMAKPEREIFEHCLKSLNVEAGEALFIDDREANVEAAKAIGIRGILAPTPARLLENLRAIGFAPLPEETQGFLNAGG